MVWSRIKYKLIHLSQIISEPKRLRTSVPAIRLAVGAVGLAVGIAAIPVHGSLVVGRGLVRGVRLAIRVTAVGLAIVVVPVGAVGLAIMVAAIGAVGLAIVVIPVGIVAHAALVAVGRRLVRGVGGVRFAVGI